jgi:hypothetical protein
MLSRQKLKQLQRALIDAFPSRSLLERLLYFELEKNLNEITRESDLQEIVFKLIQTAESQGWLEGLVQAAREENPGNSELEAIAEELFPIVERKQTGDETPRTSKSNISQKPNNQQQKILVVNTSVVIVFVLIAGGTILWMWNKTPHELLEQMERMEQTEHR